LLRNWDYLTYRNVNLIMSDREKAS
jgi:hypothetical protein